MSLPDDYTEYVKRGRGQDHERYQWRAMRTHSQKAFPDGKVLGVSIVTPLEYFMLNPSREPFVHPGGMVTPYPDLRHYTTRDYGNRIGAFRLLKAMNDEGIKATFAVNGALLDRIRPLIDAIAGAGHEIAAHGYDTDSIHHCGAPDGAEERYIEKTRIAFEKAGLSPRTWMSPARQQSFKTLDLIRAAGFDICLDWEPDVVPLPMTTQAGSVVAFPLLNELDDRNLLQVKHHTEAEWRDQILEAKNMMKEEANRQGAQAMAFTMTPYISAQPFRMWAVREILTDLSSDDMISIGTVSEISDYYA